jgi:hypothetical protein
MKIFYPAFSLILCIQLSSENLKSPPFSLQHLEMADYDHTKSYMAFGLMVNDQYSGLEVIQEDSGSGTARIRLNNTLYILKKQSSYKINLKILNQTYTHKFVWSTDKVTVELICYDFLDKHDIEDPESKEESCYQGIMTVSLGKSKSQFKVYGYTSSQ